MKFSLCVARRNDGKIQPFYVYIVAFALGVHVLLFFSSSFFNAAQKRRTKKHILWQLQSSSANKILTYELYFMLSLCYVCLFAMLSYIVSGNQTSFKLS